jgi:Ca2+-binding EF-hand superfamily protein
MKCIISSISCIAVGLLCIISATAADKPLYEGADPNARKPQLSSAETSKLTAAFAGMDTNGDLALDKTELQAFLSKTIDSINAEEARPHLEKAKIAAADLFKTVDSNNDGFITKDEAWAESQSAEQEARNERRWEFADDNKV